MLPDHYSYYKQAFKDPHLILSELNRLYHRRLYSQPYNVSGIDIIKEDWDNLLILDACRYDSFEKISKLEGRLEKRESRASATVEFLKANFSGRELLDVVYVTANPQFHRRRDEFDVQFHHVENAWRDNWMDDVNSVPPETMSAAVVEAAERFPRKRIIAHYIQPHYPFISELGHSLPEVGSSSSFWRSLRRDDFDEAQTDLERRVEQAYEADLELALDAISDILDGLVGETVITADHGQLFGERVGPIPVREYAHPQGIYVDELVEVPWFIVNPDVEERKEITAEPPVTSEDDVREDKVNQRLSDLGYIT